MIQEGEGKGARAQRLMDDALNRGRVELPTLTREELAALGALDVGAIRDGEEISWWTGMDEDMRQAVAVAAIRGLGARGLLDLAPRQPAGDSEQVQLPLEPELSAVLVPRANPAFLIVGRDPVGGQRGRTWVYGIVEQGRGLRCILFERVEDTALHRFALCAPARGLTDFAEWACAPATAVDENGRPGPMLRTVEIIQPAEGGPNQHRFIVLAGPDGARAARVRSETEPFEPSEITPDQLAAQLLKLVDTVATAE